MEHALASRPCRRQRGDQGCDGCTITAPAGDAAKIAGVDRTVGQGDVVRLGAWEASVIDVGGHTLGHVAYYVPGADRLRRRSPVRARLRADVRGDGATILGQSLAPEGAARNGNLLRP
jgi:hypothetical protein